MKYTPIITNGILSHWPMFSVMLSSKFTWFSFRNSMKKRKVNLFRSQRPKKKPR